MYVSMLLFLLNFCDINSLNVGGKVPVNNLFSIDNFDIFTVYSQSWGAWTCAVIKLVVVFDWIVVKIMIFFLVKI